MESRGSLQVSEPGRRRQTTKVLSRHYHEAKLKSFTRIPGITAAVTAQTITAQTITAQTITAQTILAQGIKAPDA